MAGRGMRLSEGRRSILATPPSHSLKLTRRAVLSGQLARSAGVPYSSGSLPVSAGQLSSTPLGTPTHTLSFTTEMIVAEPAVKPTTGSALSRIARPAVLLTLAIGMYLHLTRLFIGSELLLEYVFAPAFDTVFAVPMLVGVVSFWPAWRRMAFRNTFEKVIVAMTVVLFVGSIPLHVQTWYTHNTDYVLVFPMWYSLIFLGYSSVMVFIWSRLKIGPQPDPAR